MDLILKVFLIFISIIGIFVTACIAPHLFVVALAFFMRLKCCSSSEESLSSIVDCQNCER